MTSGDLLLLDTNVLVHVARWNALGRALDERFGLTARTDRPLISIITVGEGLALGRRFGWGAPKLNRLRDLFRNLVVVDIGRAGIAERYAEIADATRRSGRAVGQNDLWIAATASVVRATLVTTDWDFDAIDAALLSHVWVDPAGAEDAM